MQRVIGCHMHFATLVEKKRGDRDNIKYTWTKLKIVWLGFARTHGWVELAPTVPTSSSHRSSTVIVYCYFLFAFHPCKYCKNAPINFVVIIFAKNLEVHCFTRRRHKCLSRQSIAGQIIAAWYMNIHMRSSSGLKC